MRHLILTFFVCFCVYSNAVQSQFVPLERYEGALPAAIEAIRTECLVKKTCPMLTRMLKRGSLSTQALAIYAIGENYPDPNSEANSEWSWRVWAEIVPNVLVELTQGLSDRVFKERAICARLTALVSTPFILEAGRRSWIIRVGCEISGSGRGFIASDILLFQRNDQIRMIPLVDESQRSLSFGINIGSSLKSDVRLTLGKEGVHTLLYQFVNSSWSDTKPSRTSINYETIMIRGEHITRSSAPLSVAREFTDAKALISLSR